MDDLKSSLGLDLKTERRRKSPVAVTNGDEVLRSENTKKVKRKRARIGGSNLTKIAVKPEEYKRRERPSFHKRDEQRFDRFDAPKREYPTQEEKKERLDYEQRYHAMRSNTGERRKVRPEHTKTPKKNSKGFSPKEKFVAPEPVRYDAGFSEDQDIRLNKFLSNAGVCSRREADEMIRKGRISVNGEVVAELGKHVSIKDEVFVDGRLVELQAKVYVLMNKPKNCVTTLEDPESRTTVMDILKRSGASFDERIYPVGRLDRMTTGVLLLTNDGDMAVKLMHPKFEKRKVYQVWLDKPVLVEDMQRIAQGLTLEDGEIHADAISYIKDDDLSQVGIEIHSGRNRIVRRIFEFLGYRVIKLDRVYFAGLTKKNLPRGRWRYLNEEEVRKLRTGQFE